MDPRLLQYYNIELQHLREMGAEFAEQFPKIAARLGMNGLEVTDPYVERLLEGVGFLAARAPQARRGIPALHAGAARDNLSALSGTDAVDAHRAIHTGRQRAGLASGVKVPRGTTMRGVKGADDPTECEFPRRRTSRYGRSRSCRRATSTRPICR